MAQDLNAISANLSRLKLDEDVSQSIEQRADLQLVDTPEAVKSMVDILSSLGSDCSMSLDLEGVNLCRHGSISLLQLWIPPCEQAFIVDVHVLGTQAFDTSNSEGKTLRSILESDRVRKYFFDVRNDADALYALFGVRLAGVTDVQLLELASRSGPKHVLCGLAACIEQEQALPLPALSKWQSTKTEVVKMFDPKLGGSYEVFNTRPLLQILMDYCVGDVQFLPMLSTTYGKRLSKGWTKEVRIESEKRVKESRGPKYSPRGRHNIFGPKSWRFPPKSKAGPSTIATASANTMALQSAAQTTVGKSCLRTLTFTDNIQVQSERLWQTPIVFVPEGSKKQRKSKAKQPSASLSNTNQTCNMFDDQNWALCDKDCGWCGHCGDGII